MTSRIASEGPIVEERESTVAGVRVFVVKLPDDPRCLRASLGGDPTEGYYLTYRGDREAIKHLLETTLEAFRASA